eukprot:5394776-Prymnesium_polylepis.1
MEGTRRTARWGGEVEQGWPYAGGSQQRCPRLSRPVLVACWARARRGAQGAHGRRGRTGAGRKPVRASELHSSPPGGRDATSQAHSSVAAGLHAQEVRRGPSRCGRRASAGRNRARPQAARRLWPARRCARSWLMQPAQLARVAPRGVCAGAWRWEGRGSSREGGGHATFDDGGKEPTYVPRTKPAAPAALSTRASSRRLSGFVCVRSSATLERALEPLPGRASSSEGSSPPVKRWPSATDCPIPSFSKRSSSTLEGVVSLSSVSSSSPSCTEFIACWLDIWDRLSWPEAMARRAESGFKMGARPRRSCPALDEPASRTCDGDCVGARAAADEARTGRGGCVAPSRPAAQVAVAGRERERGAGSFSGACRSTG